MQKQFLERPLAQSSKKANHPQLPQQNQSDLIKAQKDFNKLFIVEQKRSATNKKRPHQNYSTTAG